ncbi:hypothetical protein ACFWFQ_14905 [Nocardia salmonicida]
MIDAPGSSPGSVHLLPGLLSGLIGDHHRGPSNGSSAPTPP